MKRNLEKSIEISRNESDGGDLAPDLAPESESRPNTNNQGFWTRERGQRDWAGSRRTSIGLGGTV